MTFKTMADAHGLFIDWDDQVLQLDIPRKFMDEPYEAELLHPDFCDWWKPV